MVVSLLQMHSMELISLKDVSKVYEADGEPLRAIDGIDLSISDGEFVAILGPSGSGKSTLLQILGLLDPLTSGTYQFCGEDTRGMSDDQLALLRNSRMGFVFQSFHLLARTTVLENVMLPFAYAQVPKKEWEPRARAMIERVGLSHRLTHEPSKLSGGERQRVAIARALVLEPQVIFADEPTGNLDTKSGQSVMDVISSLHREGRTIVLITHDRTLAKHANRAVLIQDGKKQWDGPALQIPDVHISV
jgi:putative ABC transport system ATP-binding protein